jgi:hypothetical protein
LINPERELQAIQQMLLTLTNNSLTSGHLNQSSS